MLLFISFGITGFRMRTIARCLLHYGVDGNTERVRMWCLPYQYRSIGRLIGKEATTLEADCTTAGAVGFSERIAPYGDELVLLAAAERRMLQGDTLSIT